MKQETCPICGKKLRATVRVREERVPSTVPDYYSREKEAPYRQTVNYEIVKCSEDHMFKRTNNGRDLYGMKVDLL
jgi:hypothetical protein